MSGGCVGVEALTAGSTALLDGQLQTLLESWNPLDCLLCRQELVQPVRLSCHHSFCRRCLADRNKCPACDQAIEGEPEADDMVNFLIETSHESADVCANCDKISQPMHFCETCHQPLCNSCKVNTHQAKMFAAHRIVPLEERARARGRGVCADHGEAFILFSTDTRELVCINCFKAASLESRHHYVDLDVAHKIGCEKLDKVTTKLKVFQQDVREQMQLRRRLLNELDDSFKAQDAQVRQTCQQMIDGLMQVRDRLLQELDADRRTRESHFNDQLKNLCAMLPSIHLYLLSSSIFCASASKIDFLDSAHDLIKRIQNLTGDGGQLSKPLYTGQLSSDSREEYARALEPFLGLSSLLLTRGSGRSGSDANGVDCSGTISPRRCSRRSGSGYVNCPNALAMSKYQLIVDLAGAFGEEFARIETPVRLLAHQMSALTKETQELQRDLTLRRCLIDKVRVNELIARCVDVDTKLATHSALIQDTQPQLQHIWQEQLDRVRRQQQLFREKVEQTVQLREDARHVSAVARQLEPFALSLAAAASLIDPRRCHPPDPAPMERICLEINTIAPDSQHRIEAIEKEEHNRKMVMEQKKREETNELMSAKRQLKMTKEHRKSGKATAVDGRVVRNVGRDRSRGGTDHALLSPTKRKERNSPAVSPRPVSDDQSSATDEFESSMDESFEFTASEASASVEIVQRREIRLLRSKTLHAPRQQATTVAPLAPVSCSLPENDGHNLETSMANMRMQQTAQTAGNSNPTQPPKPPSVPASVFAVNANSVQPATWRAREMVLESLKQVVPLVNVGATRSPDRQLPDDADVQ